MLNKILLISFMSLLATACEDNSNDTKHLQIASHKVICSGEIQQSLCLTQIISQDNQKIFHNTISNFNFQWGFSYRIAVKTSQTTNPPEDSSSTNYSLVEILSENEDPAGTNYQYQNVELLENTFVKESDTYYFLEQAFECANAVDCDALVAINNSGGLVNVNFEYMGEGKIKLTSWN